jgi:hypothetical protein
MGAAVEEAAGPGAEQVVEIEPEAETAPAGGGEGGEE